MCVRMYVFGWRVCIYVDPFKCISDERYLEAECIMLTCGSLRQQWGGLQYTNSTKYVVFMIQYI